MPSFIEKSIEQIRNLWDKSTTAQKILYGGLFFLNSSWSYFNLAGAKYYL